MPERIVGCPHEEGIGCDGPGLPGMPLLEEPERAAQTFRKETAYTRVEKVVKTTP